MICLGGREILLISFSLWLNSQTKGAKSPSWALSIQRKDAQGRDSESFFGGIESKWKTLWSILTSFCDFRVIDFWLFYSLQMKNCQSKISRISRISWFSDLLNEFLIFTMQFRESIIALALDKVQICMLSHNIWTLQEETEDLKKCSLLDSKR